jgi:antitoxin component of RelBE/YafQ-DinJ toxin-antitoxin module
MKTDSVVRARVDAATKEDATQALLVIGFCL